MCELPLIIFDFNFFKTKLSLKSVGNGVWFVSEISLVQLFYDTTYLCVFFKKYLPYGQTFHRITGTQVKGSNLAKLFLELASAEKITKMTYSIDSGHRYSPAVIGTAVVMIKFRLWLGL